MKKFTRRRENFVCLNCGKFVFGNGYTNHCPECLWSKHVDNHPGDRASECNGPMKPIGLDRKKGRFIIVHQCQKCFKIKKNKASANDDFSSLIRLSEHPNR